MNLDWSSLRRDYRTVVADPPWPYKTRDAMVRNYKADGSGVATGAGDTGYEFMSLDRIASLPVQDHVVATGAHLYLWTTNSFLVEAHEVALSWGFKPKTVLTWVKTIKDDPCAVSRKSGYYFRGATEHVVFAVRGSMRLTTDRAIATAFLHPRLPHSVKPAKFYSDLVESCSPGPYLELFARESREGWDAWGDGK